MKRVEIVDPGTILAASGIALAMVLWGLDKIFDFTTASNPSRYRRIKLLLGFLYFAIGAFLIAVLLVLTISQGKQVTSGLESVFSLNLDPTFLLALATVVLAIVTTYSALQTRNSVKILERTASLEFLPFLKGSIEFLGPVSVAFQIANVGKSTASNISVEYWIREKADKTKRNWVKDFLTVGESQRFFIPIDEQKEELSIEKFRIQQTTIEIKSTCSDSLGKKHDRLESIDLTGYIRQYDRTKAEYSDKWYDKIASAVKEMANSLAKLSDKTSKIENSIDNIVEIQRTGIQISSARRIIHDSDLEESKKKLFYAKVDLLEISLEKDYVTQQDLLIIVNQMDEIDRNVTRSIFETIYTLKMRGIKLEPKEESISKK